MSIAEKTKAILQRNEIYVEYLDPTGQKRRDVRYAARLLAAHDWAMSGASVQFKARPERSERVVRLAVAMEGARV